MHHTWLGASLRGSSFSVLFPGSELLFSRNSSEFNDEAQQPPCVVCKHASLGVTLGRAPVPHCSLSITHAAVDKFLRGRPVNLPLRIFSRSIVGFELLSQLAPDLFAQKVNKDHCFCLSQVAS